LDSGRVLLFGATGMVGRNILEHPRAASLEILAPRRSEVDLFEYEAVVRYIRHHAPSVVIHAAGRVGGIQANIREPVKFFLENLDLGRNVIWAARNCGVKRLLNIASSCMYPRNAENPLREEQVLGGELEPTNEGYALAKIAALRLCEYISREAPSFLYRTVIPCNLYGLHDKFDPAHSHLVASIIRKLNEAIAGGRPHVEIWGDGLARREFMFAGDVADFVFEALARFDELPVTMNLGVGQDHTVNTYYEIGAEVTGWKGHFDHDMSKPVGMKRKLLQIERQRAWGWTPKTTLRDGIARTQEHYVRNHIK
jgi:GDP-L-fucose synthase